MKGQTTYTIAWLVIQLFPNSSRGWCVECGMDTTAKDGRGSDPDCICGQRCQSMDMVTEGERSVFIVVYVYIVLAMSQAP